MCLDCEHIFGSLGIMVNTILAFSLKVVLLQKDFFFYCSWRQNFIQW